MDVSNQLSVELDLHAALESVLNYYKRSVRTDFVRQLLASQVQEPEAQSHGHGAKSCRRYQ